MSELGLRAIFLAERSMLQRLLVARLGNADEAEEMLQELWLKLDIATGPVAEPFAYLCRMAANLATDRRRSAQRRENRQRDWADGQARAEEFPDAERTMLARERLAQVESAIDAMPERVATAFRLYRLEGLQQKQVAERMGISLSRVEQLLQTAYRRIHALRDPGGGVSTHRCRPMSEEEHRDVR